MRVYVVFDYVGILARFTQNGLPRVYGRARRAKKA